MKLAGKQEAAGAGVALPGTRREMWALAVLMLAATIALTVSAIRLPSAVFENLVLALLGLVCLCWAALALIYRPHLGILLVIPAALILPPAIERMLPAGVSLTFLLAPFVIGAWALNVLSRRFEDGWMPSIATAPLLVLMLAACTSFVVGKYPWFPVPGAPMRAQLGALGMFLFSGGLFLAGEHLLRNSIWLRRITWAFLLCAAVRIVLLLLPAPSGALSGLMPSGTLGSLFWVWLTALALSQALLNHQLSPGWRFALLCLVASAAYLAFFEWHSWASGWLPALTAAGVITALWRPKVAAVSLALFVTASVWKFEGLWQALWTGEQNYSFLTRVEAMRTLSQIALASPVFGLGPANYYHYTPLYPILGWHVNFSSHNNYVDIFLQAGAIGLIAFLWFAAAVGRIAFRLLRQPQDGFSRAYVPGAMGGLAGTLCAAALGDWVIPFAYNVGMAGFSVSVLAWVFLGGLVALHHGANERMS